MYNETFVDALRAERLQPPRNLPVSPAPLARPAERLKAAQSVASKFNIKKMEIEQFSPVKIEPVADLGWVADVAPSQAQEEFVPAPDLSLEEMELRASGKRRGPPDSWDEQFQAEAQLQQQGRVAGFMFSFFVGLYLAMLTVFVCIIVYNGFTAAGVR